uniref:Envelope-like protein n=1 Tax=Cucumis melo TaxID=3656 RepID=A0A9I9DFZ8_CUCME
MDFNDLDDVSLAPLIKKASVPDVVTEKSTDHVLSVHSQGSSSSEAEGRTDVCNDEPPAGDDDVAELSILMTIMVRFLLMIMLIKVLIMILNQRLN